MPIIMTTASTTHDGEIPNYIDSLAFMPNEPIMTVVDKELGSPS